jgi:probable HAF family extracellular repeat protein
MKLRCVRNFLIGLIGALVISFGLSIFTATTATPSFYYSITDLGVFNPAIYHYSSGDAINDAGEATGLLRPIPSASIGFLWKNGTMQVLQGIVYHTYVHDINSTAQVVGETINSGEIPIPPFRASLWSNNTIKDLGTFESKGSSYAYGINDAGYIVGGASKNEYLHAVLWDQVTMKDLGTLEGYTNSMAHAINEAGQIVGNVSKSIDSNFISHATLWDKGIIKDLGTLKGYTNSYASDINSKGQIVGYATNYYHNKETSRAFLWDKGKMKSLGTLGGNNSWAYSINNKGQVVGKALINNEFRPFMWVNGKMRDLNTLITANSGWKITDVKDINNKGQIVGTGSFNNQDPHAVILTPTWVTNINPDKSRFIINSVDIASLVTEKLTPIIPTATKR